MDIDKIGEWLKLAQQYDESDFWKQVLERGTPGFTSVEAVEVRERAELWRPRADVFYEEKANIAVVELPGVYKEDIRLTVTGCMLTVSGIVKPPPLGAATPICTERYYGPFERVLTLPQFGQGSRIAARFDRGLLLVRYERSVDVEQSVYIE